MKNSFVLKNLFVLSLLLSFSCSDDDPSEEFEEVNGAVEEKLLKQVSIFPTKSDQDEVHIFADYDGYNRLSNIRQGNNNIVFAYKDDKLSNIAGEDNGVFNIEELYNSPYDAFEAGQVEEYDANGNPYILTFYEEDYDYYSDTYEVLEYTAEITYDDAPNPYYYTLQSAGIIDMLDKVELNFSTIPQSSKIVKAKKLFFVNNPSKIVYKDENGIPVYQIDLDYVYDDQDYPVSATVVATSMDDGDTDVLRATYLYE